MQTIDLKKQKFSYVIAVIIILMASFDIFGALNIFGFTFRISQIFILIGIVYLLTSKKITLPVGYRSLFIWIMLQAVFILRSSHIVAAIGYFFWLILDVAIIFFFQELFKTVEGTDELIKLYIFSFVIISMLGLVQWILSIGGINFYLTQPTLNGSRIPRLNGFTFEPSYYATYLMPGWVLIMYLTENGSDLFTKKQLYIYAMIVSLALFLSTSRMGWIFMAAWIAFRMLSFWGYMISVSGKIKKSKLLFYFLLILAVISVMILAAMVIHKNGIEFIVSGLGLFGTSTHSSGARTSQFWNTLSLFRESPILGYSLGGVAARYCEKFNMVYDSGASMCIWAEVLVASGLVGTIPFIIWFINLLSSMRRTYVVPERVREVKALLYGFVFECGILALNQNILRIYFWVLIAVMNVVVFGYRKGNTYGSGS